MVQSLQCPVLNPPIFEQTNGGLEAHERLCELKFVVLPITPYTIDIACTIRSSRVDEPQRER